MKFAKDTNGSPVLSVIVPVYNSRAELEQCLAALTKSRYDDFEVLVVDDGSTVPIEPLAEEYGFGYLRIDGPGGPARARNRGVEKARGRYVVFIDADVSVHTDTLALFADAFARDPVPERVDAVVGSYDDAPACPGFLSQYKNLFHHYVHQQSRGEIQTFWSGCGAMKRDLFLAFGGFDEKRYRRPAIEDIELGARMSAAGRRIVLDGRIRAKHLKRWTLVNLLKTDILDRGIPWTRLMLRAGEMASTLNVTPVQRLSVALTYLALFALLVAGFWPMALAGTVASAVTITILNLDFYRFLSRHRGFRFTLRAMPMHWLYFLYCGFSAVCGALLHYLQPEKARFWTLLIILAAGVFYLSTIRPGHHWGDDFSMYISHARNIAEGRSYADTGYIYNPRKIIGPKTYPPVYPLLLAPVYRLWGLNLTAMKVEVILIFLLSLFVIHLAFRHELEWPYLPALIALVGFNPQLWLFKDNVISDIPFLLFTYLGLYLIHRAYRPDRAAASQIVHALSIGVAIYLASGVRSIGLVLIPCLFIYHIIRGGRAGIVGLSVILLTIALIHFQTNSLSAYAGHLGLNEKQVALNHGRELIQCLSGFWTNGSSHVLPRALFAVLTGLAIVGYLARIGKKQVTCFELFVPCYLVPFIILPVTIELRYVIPIVPLYLFHAFLGIQTISRSAVARWQGVERLAFAGVLITVLVSYAAQYTRLDYGPIRKGIAKAETRQLFEYVRKETNEKDVVIFGRPKALSLFTGRASAIWHNPPDDRDLWDFFRRVNASYLITGPADLDPEDQNFIRNFVDRNRGEERSFPVKTKVS